MGKSSAPAAGGYTPPQNGQLTEDQIKQRYMKDVPEFQRNIGGEGLYNSYKSKLTQPNPYQQAADATASANRPNQTSPFGSISWQRDPTTGAWTQNSNLAPGLTDAASGFMSKLTGSSGADARKAAEDAIYSRATARLDPQWSSREHDMGVQLANQGIDPNSAAYTKAQTDFGRSRNDAYSSALQDAIMGGGQEEARQQGLALQGLGGLQGLTSQPGFQAGPNYLAAAGMYNDYNLQKAQTDNSWLADLINGGAKVGAAAAGKA